MHAVSLFSNCGAGDVGYKEAGFKFDVMAELVPKRLDVCVRNHPGTEGVPGDLLKTWKDVVTKWRDVHGDAPPALLTACPPCQGMSSARSFKRGEKKTDTNDPRNLLVSVVADVVDALLPTVVVVENVPQFLTRIVVPAEDGSQEQGKTAPDVLFDRLGDRYAFYSIVTDLADFGVPQRRRRTFVVLVDRTSPAYEVLSAARALPLPKPTHEKENHVTMGAAFQPYRLEPLDASSEAKALSTCDPLHRVPVWNERQYRMVAATKPKSSAWNNTTCANDCANEHVDADAATCPSCGEPLLRPVVLDDGKWRLVKGFRKSSYWRCDLEAPAPTVTTASGHVGSDHTLHPTEHRVLSVRECAILQTFPDDFDWGDAPESWGYGQVREMIGEAVPPRFTRMHGEVLRALVVGELPPRLMQEGDPRHELAARKLAFEETRRRQAELELP